MAVREIITVPNKLLKKNCKDVKDFGPDTQNLIDDMIETMRVAPGVGLAAPQIGILQNIVVVEYFENEEDAEIEDKEPKLFELVNPKIKKYSDIVIDGIEGCLSIPGYIGTVTRSESITIKGQNRHGQKITLKPKGWLARIFQHEVDHLSGVLFTDRAIDITELGEDDEYVDNV